MKSGFKFKSKVFVHEFQKWKMIDKKICRKKTEFVIDSEWHVPFFQLASLHGRTDI